MFATSSETSARLVTLRKSNPCFSREGGPRTAIFDHLTGPLVPINIYIAYAWNLNRPFLAFRPRMGFFDVYLTFLQNLKCPERSTMHHRPPAKLAVVWTSVFTVGAWMLTYTWVTARESAPAPGSFAGEPDRDIDIGTGAEAAVDYSAQGPGGGSVVESPFD